VAGLVASSTCAYSLYDIAWAASISPLSRACMSNCCCTSVTSDGAIPAFVMPANSSNSLPKPQLPTFLPRRSAGAAMPLSANDTW
jgi:hypothetical protein